MRKIIIILIMFLFACSYNTEQKEQTQDSIQKQENLLVVKQIKEAKLLSKKKYNQFLSKTENLLIRNYIHYYYLNTEKDFSKTENMIIGEEEFQLKIYKNKNKEVYDGNFDIEKSSADYFFEIRRFKNGVPIVFIKGDYISLFHDGVPMKMALFSKTLFVVNDNALIVYKFSIPYGKDLKKVQGAYPEWVYTLKKDSYLLSEDGKLHIMEKEIYIEDYNIINNLGSNISVQTQKINFNNPPFEYIEIVEKKHDAMYDIKEDFYETILFLMLDDFNDMNTETMYQ